ncbi:MAG: C39 family peptidase [Clostridia bacterium]|nr:C39 family peptidase [Clostridia bacterium]
MASLTYKFTGNEKTPAEITLNEYTTPIWIQQKWESGKYAEYIRKNGCGHCCTAMALNLNGVKITPHEEFELCRKLWGEPRMHEPFNEDNFISASGIVKIIKHFGVFAKCFGVENGKSNEAAKHIKEMLLKGKQVILGSHPSEKLLNNPFSSGKHYILAVGIDDEGKVLIANSSERAATKYGIQHTDVETIAKVLYEGCEPWDFTWGRYDPAHNGGYVVVG